MAETLTYSGELTITRCWCGIRVGIPAELYRQMQNDHKHAAFCPLGHEFVYGKNDADRLREQLATAKRQAEFARASRDAAWDQARAAERSARAYRGHLTRLRNKIANGVCPVAGCRRHFDNVQAHIAGEHPAWAAEHPEAL
jgi:hypothetical protein